MKKRTKLILFLLILVILIAYGGIIFYTYHRLTHAQPSPLHAIYQNKEFRKVIGLGENRTPADYGFSKYNEENFSAIYNNLRLTGWYIPSIANSVSTRTLILVHGYRANRLWMLQYLDMVKNVGLDTTHNVFIPDLRGCGNSARGTTGLGYKHAEDLAAGLLHLNKQYKQNEFDILAVSQGAMATALMLHRNDIKTKFDQVNMKVTKLIFDSPVSNTRAIAEYRMDKKMGVPCFIYKPALILFNISIDGYLDKMRLSVLLGSDPRNFLIFQNTKDGLTKKEFLDRELNGLPNVEVVWFDNNSLPNSNHAVIYIVPENRKIYDSTVAKFFNKGS